MPTFRFDTFELRPKTRELYRAGIRLKLRPQPFHVLQVLLEEAGKVVSREEFQKKLWASDTFVDFEHGLNSSVRDLRAVLGDSVQEPRFIETLPKIGYRFIAQVAVEDETIAPARNVASPSSILASATREAKPGSEASKPTSAFAADESTSGRPTRRWQLAIAGFACAAALLAILTAAYRSRHSNLEAAPAGRIMVAVLPFENHGGDTAEEYLPEGLTEEIIARLNRVDPKQIGVIARTSVAKYKPESKSIENAGRELGVQYVLEGALTHDADKIAVTTKLIRVRDQAQLWTHEFDRTATNLRDIQEEIAEETSDAIFLALGEQKRGEPAHPAAASTKNQSDAYLHYLKGRYFWNRRDEEGFELAIREFQSAIDIDPNYAQAYAGLADAYSISTSYNVLPSRIYMPKARAAALRALQIDETLAEAHVSLAVVAQNFNWDWQTAEREYRRAIELNPNYATAHHWYAECLALEGRFSEANAEIAKARELDPLSLIIGADYGAILYFSKSYGPAIQQFHTVLEMNPRFPRGQMIIYTYVEEGRFREALEVIKKWPLDDRASWAWSQTAYIYGRWGKKAEAEQAYAEALKANQKLKLDPCLFVISNLGMGNKKEAMGWLEKAYAEHSPMLTALKVDPTYEPLRTEARYHEILRGMKLEN